MRSKAHKIKIAKSLRWLSPFILEASRILSLRQIKTIKAYRVGIKRSTKSDGSIIGNGRNYVITIRTHSNELVNGKLAQCPIATDAILFTLAHELAHLKEWDHTGDHFRLLSKLLMSFSLVMFRRKTKDYYKAREWTTQN